MLLGKDMIPHSFASVTSSTQNKVQYWRKHTWLYESNVYWTVHHCNSWRM